MIIETPEIISAVSVLFSSDKNETGSYDRLNNILSKIPQNKDEKVRYLIAGSWAIEIISGDKREDHSDIDIISVSEPPFYFDDAITTEEHCCEVIPLHKDYFKRMKSILFCEDTRGKGNIYVPNANLQICFKLIGELSPFLSDRAINQLMSLLKTYNDIKPGDIEEIYEILSSCLPKKLNFFELSKKISNAVSFYIKKEEIKSIELLREVHTQINSALQEEFKKLSWNEYAKKNKGVHNC